MDNSNHTSIDIKNLADSLRGKFETLYFLSEECCIYRVPPETWRLNPIAFAPQTVSIGPIHHGKEELKAMEDHKIRYLLHFLQRTRVSIEKFLSFIKDKEEKLRKCYAKIIELESDEFVMMILVDAVFLIEYFLRSSIPDLVTNDDHIFRKPWIDVRWDFWLVENQIPLFIIKDLFDLAKSATNGVTYEGLSLIKITDSFRQDILYYFPFEENLFETYFSEAKHFLDLLRLCLRETIPSQTSPAEKKRKPQNILTLTELHQAGVQFKNKSSTKLFDITFAKGILEIPFLRILDPTDVLFRNLLAFEKLHCLTAPSLSVNDYVIIMNYLLNTTKDVELLIENGVLENWLSNNQAVSTLFHELVKDAVLNTENFRYADLIEELKVYRRIPWHRWKANLKQNYCNTPWATISIVAAVLLLLLTLIQAVCAVIAL